MSSSPETVVGDNVGSPESAAGNPAGGNNTAGSADTNKNRMPDLKGVVTWYDKEESGLQKKIVIWALKAKTNVEAMADRDWQYRKDHSISFEIDHAYRERTGCNRAFRLRCIPEQGSEDKIWPCVYDD